jgi:hypothetical protein
MGFLAREFPHLVEGYGRLYAGAYAKPDYVSGVRAMIATIQDRYDLRPRKRARQTPAEPLAETGEPSQSTLDW